MKMICFLGYSKNLKACSTYVMNIPAENVSFFYSKNCPLSPLLDIMVYSLTSTSIL